MNLFPPDYDFQFNFSVFSKTLLDHLPADPEFHHPGALCNKQSSIPSLNATRTRAKVPPVYPSEIPNLQQCANMQHVFCDTILCSAYGVLFFEGPCGIPVSTIHLGDEFYFHPKIVQTKLKCCAPERLSPNHALTNIGITFHSRRYTMVMSSKGARSSGACGRFWALSGVGYFR